MALWGAEQDYCDRSHTLNPPSGINTYTQTHLHRLYNIETHSLVLLLTFQRDPSQCSFVFSEKNKKTG